MKAFSDNIIFVDTEFSALDPYKGEILSVGMVKLSGEEFYEEVEYDGEYSEWVKENILPTLTREKISRDSVKDKIREFVGEGRPYMVAYVNSFDVIYLYKLLQSRGEPFSWIPIDFASILFGVGIDPSSYYQGNEADFASQMGVDTTNYHQHHALDDAKLLREVYMKMANSSVSG